MQSIKVGICALFLFNVHAYAEDLNEKVARNAANCLTGHVATNSAAFQAGDTSKYVFLIEEILGSAKASSAIQDASQKLDSAVRMLGSTKKEEGEFLISKFCAAINEIIASRS